MHNSTFTDGKIVPLFLNRPFMKDVITQEILEYWEGLRQGRLVPKRSEIDPRKLTHSLNYSFILEASTPDNIRFRLAGSKLCDCMGMEMRGMPAYSMVTQKDRNTFNITLQTALLRPEILDYQLTPDARLLLLPMSDESDTVNRFLGCISVVPNQSGLPDRFKVKSLSKTRIIATKSIKPRLVSELAEDQQPFVKKATPSGPPHLRIIK